MMNRIKVAILKETKTPPDKRAALAPEQALELMRKFPNVDLIVQKSDIRAYKDEEYSALGIKLTDDLSDCDILIGVKEVAIQALMPGKTYLFFSHTAKKQEYNRTLLQKLLELKIRMVDHEYLTSKEGFRLVAFGRWAGLVGAYNAIIGLGRRTGKFNLKRAIECHDVAEMFSELKKVSMPPVKILITGGGRVAHGAIETLMPLNIKKVSPEDFLENNYTEAVYTQLDPQYYVERIDGAEFDLNHFFKNPQMYKSIFAPYTKAADMYIPCHFWDEKSPFFFTKEDMKHPDFKISVVADVSCDIDGPVPCTVRPSEIAKPFYGFNPKTGTESEPFDKENITVMAVDNLPGEVPRDASVDFGKGLIEKVFPSLFGNDTDGIIERATITEGGKLGKYFEYLENFAKGK